MMFDNYRSQYLADFVSKGHTPYLDEDGKVDLFITDQEMHNGPGCSICGWTACMLCLVGEIPVCKPRQATETRTEC